MKVKLRIVAATPAFSPGEWESNAKVFLTAKGLTKEQAKNLNNVITKALEK